MTVFDDRQKWFALWFTIQGVDRVFKEIATIDCSTILGETRPESAIIAVKGVEESGVTVDPIDRVTKGGSLKLKLLEPFGSTVCRDLFQQRRRKATRISSGGLSASAVTVNVEDTSAITTFPNIIYVGGETIAVTAAATGPVRFTGCTRAKYGSRAQAQSANVNQGAAVFAKPPAWIGRRVTLYGSFLDQRGKTTAAKTITLGTFSIEKAPANNGDRGWTIECGPVIDELLAKQCYVGLADQGGGRLFIASPTDSFWTCEVDDASKFVVATSGYKTNVLVQVAGVGNYDQFVVGELKHADSISVPNVITFVPTEMVSGVHALFDLIASLGPRTVKAVSQFAILGGNPNNMLLYALCSRAGDLSNGSFDVFPGAVPDPSQPFGVDTWRIGAGIDQADVDASAFGSHLGYPVWNYILNETVTVAELAKEWAYVAKSFIHGTATGLLSAKTMSDVPDASAKTIDDTLRIASVPPKIWVDESGVYPSVEIDATYSPLSKAFRFHDVTIDSELSQRFPTRDESLKLQFKGIAVIYDRRSIEFPQHFVYPGALPEPAIAQLARQWQLADGRGRLVVEITCKLAALSVQIGDVVLIGFGGVDYEGGTLKGRRARVMGRTPRYDENRVDFVLHVMEPVFLFAPSAVVTAVSTTTVANDTVTLSTTSPDAADANPETHFAVGQSMRLWDVSAGSSQVVTVAATIAGHKLRFTTGVGAAVEVGRDWLTWNTLGTNTGITAGDGHIENDLAYMMPNNGVPAAGDVRRLR